MGRRFQVPPTPVWSSKDLEQKLCPFSSAKLEGSNRPVIKLLSARGGETPVDTQVRDIWELDADQFVLQNHAWQATLDNTLRGVTQALGVAGGSTAIRAEIYNFLLYDKGAFFDSHTE